MLPSERIRRGFFRIGLVGAAVAAVISVVSLGLAAYERALPGRTSVYIEGDWFEVPRGISIQEARQVAQTVRTKKVLSGKKQVGLFDDLIPTDELEAAAKDVMRQSAASLDNIVNEAMVVAALSAGSGVLWFFCAWTAGWVVRGFLR